METKRYKHTKRLIILNVLSVLFIWMEWSARNSPSEQIGLLVFVPITFVVWIWTIVADVSWLLRRVIRNDFDLHLPKWLLKDVRIRKN